MSGQKNITDTPEFKAWFGNSKIVDANGSPMIVYHGSPKPISMFEKGWFDPRAWATNDFTNAFYFGNKELAQDYGSSLTAAYLKIENPYVAKTAEQFNFLEELENAEEHLRKEGHDGAILYTGENRVEYVAFSPDQIRTVNSDIASVKKALALATIESGTLYRGAPSPELGEGAFKGMWCSQDRKIAEQYGDIWEYEVLEPLKLADNSGVIDPLSDNPFTPEIDELQKEFIKRYPEQEELVNQDGSFTELWMFPPDELVELLAEKGYDGYYSGTDVFVIEPSLAKIRQKQVTTVAAKEDQTFTPEFMVWFGDSKVKDSEGNPLVVYHGTTASEFSEFKGLGVSGWFSENSALADVYAEERGVEQERIYPVYLSVKYPFDFEALGIEAETMLTPEEFSEKTGLDISLEDNYEDDDEPRPAWNYFEDFIQDDSFIMEYDGIRIKEKGAITWGVFGSENIKSAIGNKGTFDPENPDITAAKKPFDNTAVKAYAWLSKKTSAWDEQHPGGWIFSDGTYQDTMGKEHSDYLLNDILNGHWDSKLMGPRSSWLAYAFKEGYGRFRVGGGNHTANLEFGSLEDVSVTALETGLDKIKDVVWNGGSAIVEFKSYDGEHTYYEMNNKMEFGKAYRSIMNKKTEEPIGVAASVIKNMGKKPEVFLGGETKTDWRDNIIKEFKDTLKLIDPVDEDWDPSTNIYEELTDALSADEVVFFKGGEGSEGEQAVLDAADKEYAVFDDLDELEQHLKQISSSIEISDLDKLTITIEPPSDHLIGLYNKGKELTKFSYTDMLRKKIIDDKEFNDAVENLFFKAGHEGQSIPKRAIGIRYGAAPSSGKSYNYESKYYEYGVSMFVAKDEDGVVYESDDKGMEPFISDAYEDERHIVEGYLSYIKGSDGEPLLVGVKDLGLLKSATITLQIEKGDEIMTGHWKNHRVKVKTIGVDDKNQPTINGRPILTIRIPKLMPDKKTKAAIDLISSVIKSADYSEGCLMVEVPDELRRHILKEIVPQIPEDKLAKDKEETTLGIESETHCTLLFGVQPDKETYEAIKKYFMEPLVLKSLPSIGYFDNEETAAYIPIESEDLNKLHYALRKELPNKQRAGDYKPHVTIAYLNKGGRIEVDKIEPFEWKVTKIIVSRPDGTTDDIYAKGYEPEHEPVEIISSVLKELL